MTDDISMGALSGSIAERTRAARAAGCDLILHCNGNLKQMQMVAENCGELTGAAGKRAEAALKSRRSSLPIDLAAARSEFARMMSGIWPLDA
jgi:beta-N-acetylhexosaminidase